MCVHFQFVHFVGLRVVAKMLPRNLLYFVALLGLLVVFCPTIRSDDDEAPVEVDQVTDDDLNLGETVILDEDTLMDDEDDNDDDDDMPEVTEEDGVLVLTKDNFDDVVMKKDIILVEFYAPWCGHCKNLAPEYAKAAQTLKKADPPVPLAKVDATVDSDLAQRYEVSGYPTLKIFRKGEVSNYEGPRDESGIVKYMKEQSDPNWEPPPEAVITLTSEDFDDTVNEAELILVEFYAPWCGHCKRLAPELEAAAGVLKDDDPPIPIAKVDATAEKDLATRFGVTGYPTLFIFRKGEKYEYKGPREKRGILDYMRKQAGDSSEHLTSSRALKQFLEFQDDISIVGFFKTEEENLYKAYLEAGNDLREDYRFGHTFDHQLMNQYKVNPNSIVIFMPERFQSKYEPKRHVFDKADASAAEIQSFYSDNNSPLVGHMTKENMDKRYKDRPLLVAYYDVDWSFEHRKKTEIWRQKILAVAKDKEYKDVTFAVAQEEEFEDQLKDLELDDSGEEINVGLFADGKKYRMEPDEDFDLDVLRDFLKAWRKGKLQPVIKSQPVPRKQTGPVTVLVGKTFDKVVRDERKDVLVELYAPWCGHCKKLEPTYKKLAKKYKDRHSVVVAKMDATANDTPTDYSAAGFPTIYLARADDKKNPVKFEGGDRSLEALSKFIEDNASTLKAKKAKEEL
ncbi:protein disulfide-isomerase A4-like [Acanthaster planci]|uniref:Protein disulfide-isomerase n=1 Tax=Acanthaster planci TaxID=133434 RepID=A0A8B7XJF7_ACAPL|nr:protein disulfide-isomerase A4-like [Acanthaster planci]